MNKFSLVACLTIFISSTANASVEIETKMLAFVIACKPFIKDNPELVLKDFSREIFRVEITHAFIKNEIQQKYSKKVSDAMLSEANDLAVSFQKNPENENSLPKCRKIIAEMDIVKKNYGHYLPLE